MLSVWLPLNGNIQNQGLINGTTEKGTYISFTNGKIGQCATSSSSNNTIRLTSTEFPSMFANGNAYTLTCWVKVTGNADTGWVVKIGSNTCGLWWAKSAARLVWNENDNGKRIASSPIADDYTNWHHIASVIDKTISGNITARHYIDGVLSTENGTTTWDCSSHSQPAGNYIDIYPYNALINDVRIYDHALSPREVKQISTALVLHYPLAMPGQENIIANTSHEIACTYPASGFKDYYSVKTKSVPNETQYTLSFEARSTVDGDHLRTHFYSPNTTTTCESSQGIIKTASDGNMDFTLTTEWRRYWVVYTQTETTAIKSVICPRLCSPASYPSSQSGTGTVYVRNQKLEHGSHPTPWIPNPTDAEYSALGFDDGIEYDVSGYGHNGTKYGTLTYSSDTPRYNTSAVFNGTDNCIQFPFNDFCVNGDIFTMNIWWKKTELGSKSYETLIGGPSGFEMDTRAGSAQALSLYMASTRGGNVYSPFNMNEWYMVTLVNDGTNELYYVNGALVNTIAKKNMPSGNYYVGAWSNKTAQNFKGFMSDFRFYKTALSADDVLELYHTPETLSNNGTLLGYEYVET